MINKIAVKAKLNCVNIYSIAFMDGNGLRESVLQPANRCNDCYSVAKAFTMTAIGMLWDRKLIKTEDKVYDIMKDEFPEAFDQAWREVTVEHLLKHRVGFDRGFLDIDVEDISEYGTDDFLKIVLSRPLPYAPGTKWTYSDAAFYLLSRIVTKITGKTLDEIMRPTLFGALGFKELAWSRCPHGYPMGATGLYVSSSDMVKLGYVYACGGEYNGRSVVSKEWVDLALEKGYEFGNFKSSGIYAKGGMNGQMLCFSPKDRIACAWNGYEPEKDVSFLITYLAGLLSG